MLETTKVNNEGRKVTDEELLAIIESGEQQAVSYGWEIREQREESLEYYYQEPFGDEVEGRSQVVSSDVMEVIEWAMPHIMEVFAAAEEIVKFEPQDQEDVEAAQQVTDYINYIFFRQNDGFQILFNIIKDSLMLKTGWSKVWWEETESEEREEYEGLDDWEFQQLVTDEDVEVLEHTPRPSEMAVDPMMDGQAGMVHDVVIMRKVADGRVRIDVPPPEEIYPEHGAVDLDDCGFILHKYQATLSELREMGFEVPDSFYGDDEQEFDIVQNARDSVDDSFEYENTSDHLQDAMRKVWVTEACLKVDYDGDGITEWRKVTKAKYTILDNQPIDDHPYSVMCPIPIPHKLVGMSMADITRTLQRVKSSIWRSILDNLYTLNFGRYTVVEGKVNIEDLLQGRAGGVVRQTQPGMVEQLNTPAVPQQAYTMLEYLDKVRDSRTGSYEAQAMDPNMLHNTPATNANLMNTAAMSRIGLIIRIFAETGLKTMFRKIHELVRKHQDKAQVVRLRNKWVRVDPSEWRERKDMTVTVGLGHGTHQERLQKIQLFGEFVKEVRQDPELRGIVSPKNIYNLGREVLKNMEIKNYDDFLTDPEQQEGRQQEQGPDPEAIKAQAEMKKLELDQQKMQMEAQQQQMEMEMRRQEMAHERMMKEQEMQLRWAELGVENEQKRPVATGER